MSKNAGYKKLIAAGRKNKYRIAGAAVAVAVCAASLIKKAHKNGSKTVSYNFRTREILFYTDIHSLWRTTKMDMWI